MRWTAPSTLETFGVTSIMVMESRQKLPACDFFRELAHICTMKNLGICMNCQVWPDGKRFQGTYHQGMKHGGSPSGGSPLVTDGDGSAAQFFVRTVGMGMG